MGCQSRRSRDHKPIQNDSSVASRSSGAGVCGRDVNVTVPSRSSTWAFLTLPSVWGSGHSLAWGSRFRWPVLPHCDRISLTAAAKTLLLSAATFAGPWGWDVGCSGPRFSPRQGFTEVPWGTSFWVSVTQFLFPVLQIDNLYIFKIKICCRQQVHRAHHLSRTVLITGRPR